MPGSARGIALALFGIAAGACAATRVTPVVAPPPTAEAISLLGDTLWRVPMDPETAQLRLASLQRARGTLSERPDDLNAKLGVARRTAGMGRLREAIDLLSAVMDRHGVEPRVYRLRGELLLATRQLDHALRDLQVAAWSSLTDSMATEYIELDDHGLVGFGLRHAIFLAIGQVYYLKADFPRAVEALTRSLQVARNADEAAATAVWLVMAHTRSGTGMAEASALIGAWRADAQVVLRTPEHRLMLVWQGTLPLDSLARGLVEARDPDEEALYTYAAGVVRLQRRMPDEARAMFEVVRSLGNWTAMPFLAAEAELARLTGRRGGARRSDFGS